MLTAIAHNHDFGIDTVLVPGTPVRIHARISGHGSDLRGKEGTRKRSAGMRRGGDKRKEEEEEKRKGAGERKRGETGAKKPKPRGRPRRDPSRGIPDLWLRFPSGDQPCAAKYSLSLIQRNVLPTLQLLGFPIGARNFHG